MKTVAIHQPEYLPWLGLLDKAKRADVFVLLDDVQFNRASLQHRARIVDREVAWLTIPFNHRHPQLIHEVEAFDPTWTARHAQAIRRAYGDAPAFDAVWAALAPFYAESCSRVVDAAIATTRTFFDAFGVQPEVVRSSGIGAEGQKGDRVLDLCRRLGATRYLSGRSGASYLDRDAFAAAGVQIIVQSFEPPAYRPLPDVKCLSALDAWMHLGKWAKELLT